MFGNHAVISNFHVWTMQDRLCDSRSEETIITCVRDKNVSSQSTIWYISWLELLEEVIIFKLMTWWEWPMYENIPSSPSMLPCTVLAQVYCWHDLSIYIYTKLCHIQACLGWSCPQKRCYMSMHVCYHGTEVLCMGRTYKNSDVFFINFAWLECRKHYRILPCLPKFKRTHSSSFEKLLWKIKMNTVSFLT